MQKLIIPALFILLTLYFWRIFPQIASTDTYFHLSIGREVAGDIIYEKQTRQSLDDVAVIYIKNLPGLASLRPEAQTRGGEAQQG